MFLLSYGRLLEPLVSPGRNFVFLTHKISKIENLILKNEIVPGETSVPTTLP